MKIITTLALATSALALASCGPKATPADQNMTADTGMTANGMAANDTAMAPAAVSPGQAFANAAAASDAFEITTSQMAQTSASAAKVKTYAANMIKMHTDSTAKLKATTAGLTPAILPDPALTPEQQGKVDALKGKIGKDFDTAYAAAQVEAHTATLAKLKDYAATGDVPALKTFASNMVPVVTAHLNAAKGL